MFFVYLSERQRRRPNSRRFVSRKRRILYPKCVTIPRPLIFQGLFVMRQEQKMSKSKVDAHEDEHEDAHAVVETEHDNDDELSEEETNIVATIATVGVVGVGVALFEAALLPGLVLGVAAVAAPKFVPKLGSGLA